MWNFAAKLSEPLNHDLSLKRTGDLPTVVDRDVLRKIVLR